jgi:tellurite methyltransferase
VTAGDGQRERSAEAAPVSPDSLAQILLRDRARRASAGSPRNAAPNSVPSRRAASRPAGTCGSGDRTVIVDIRGRDAYRRRHVRGSVSIPMERLPGSLFLLPPRERDLLLVGRDGAAAAEGARVLSEHGRHRVAWLEGSVRELPGALLRSGEEPNRAWEPAPLLRAFIARLPRTGEAIDLACGSGRNTAFLALHRPRVLGVDILPDALLQARTLARAAGVAPGRLALRQLDLTDPRAVEALLPPHRFQVISCFRYLDRALLPFIARALAPGGWVIYQTFLEAQARAGRKPAQPAFLLKPGELRRSFESAGGMEIIHYTEGPDERGDHLASLVATLRSTAGRTCGRRPRRATPAAGTR